MILNKTNEFYEINGNYYYTIIRDFVKQISISREI